MTLVYIGHCIYFNSISFLTPHFPCSDAKKQIQDFARETVGSRMRVLYNAFSVWYNVYGPYQDVICIDV